MSRRVKGSINSVIYGMPIQATPYQTLPFSLRNSIKDAIRKGIIVVVAGGNYGPLINTMNPFANMKDVIVVGGAKNDGSDLSNFSSRGIPGVNFSGPTVVCPSENLIGRTHSGITSVIDGQKEVSSLLTKEYYEKQANHKITESEWEKIKQELVIGTGTSQAVEYLVNIIFCIINFRNKRGFFSDRKIIRRILTDMATPIKSYQNHEIGAGFVSYEIANLYLDEIHKGNIPEGEKLAWSRDYFSPLAKNGQTTIFWMDNTNSPDSVSFVDEKEKQDRDFGIR